MERYESLPAENQRNKGSLAEFCNLLLHVCGALRFWQGCELGGEGALLCRQTSAVGQTRLLNTVESRGNVGEHRKAGVMIP